MAEAYVYSAFGEQQRYGSGTTNPWHFSSKRYDPESGWIYFGRRYYDPATGRWATPDPIGFTDGPNLYAYVKNSPLTHFDTYGLLGAGTGGTSLYDINRAQRSWSLVLQTAGVPPNASHLIDGRRSLLAKVGLEIPFQKEVTAITVQSSLIYLMRSLIIM